MKAQKGFTLIELLVVLSIISLLVMIGLPSLARARLLAKGVICRSNLRQLVMANLTYADENDDRLVLAASDITSTNLKRWHGVRTTKDEPFDSTKGPLASYLADGLVKHCPQKTRFKHGEPWDMDFEDGCGGYGYNMTYTGSRIWEAGFGACDQATRQIEMPRPGETVMFGDTAMAKLDGEVPYYLEYSFVEPPFFVMNGLPQPDWGYASPSIHFRHHGRANIGWGDAHVDSQIQTDFDKPNVYGVNSAEMDLGWFGSLDNRSFDLK